MGKNNKRPKRHGSGNKNNGQTRQQVAPLLPAMPPTVGGAPVPPPIVKPAPPPKTDLKSHYQRICEICVKGRDWCERLRQAFLNRTDGILGPLLFPVALGVLLFLGVLIRGVDAEDALKPFVWAENIVLAFMAGVSTYNYQNTAEKLKELPVPTVIFRLNILIWVNAAWFTATVYFTEPTPRLSFIVAIYSTFTIANIIQVTKSAKVTTCRARSNAMLEASAFMREENGPTMIAYTLVLVAVVFHTHFRSSQHLYLEAFAGGVAAFHLGLSVVKYFLATRKNDPITSVLNAVEWNNQAAAELDAVPSKSARWKGWVGCCSLVVLVILVLHFNPSFMEQVHKVFDHLRGRS